MIIKVNNRRYFVYWQHVEQTKTTCSIYLEEKKKGDLVSEGTARRSGKDNFCRKVGRKISLMRALRVLPKKERTAFWDEFMKAETKKRISSLKKEISVLENKLSNN